LINEVVSLPSDLGGIEAGQGAVHVKEVITIDNEMHANCGLGIAKCGIDITKSEIRIPNSEICLSEIVQPLSVFRVFPFHDIEKRGLRSLGYRTWFPVTNDFLYHKSNPREQIQRHTGIIYYSILDRLSKESSESFEKLPYALWITQISKK